MKGVNVATTDKLAAAAADALPCTYFIPWAKLPAATRVG